MCEMQTVPSKIWTQVVVFISYDDNQYSTCAGITIEV